MLSISGLHNFYFIRNFSDMRCKYDRVLSIIHRQFDREPVAGDVFIMLSKNRRMVRLFNYDSRSCSLHEKRFRRGYEFMKVLHDGDREIYSIRWEDVVLLLESPVIKELKVR